MRGVGGSKSLTWANMPSAASVPANTRVYCSTIKAEMISDGTYWKPINGVAVIGGSNTAATVTGTTNKTALGTLALPAGLANIPGATLLVETLWSVTNSANSKAVRVELGSTLFYSITAASVLSNANYTSIRVRSQTVQIAMPVASASGLSTSSSACTSGSEDMATALDIVISAQLNSAADTATLEGWTVRLLTP